MIKFTAVPITLDAAAGDATNPRTITGIAVPWDTVATVSGGEKVMFKRGAFDLNAKPARLLENHDGRPIGIVNELIDLENGLGFSATFARSQQADSVVELIQMSAYDSVSVGAVPRKFKYDKNGVMIVSSADLQELSVVSVPAFADAVIEQIAASEHDPEEVEEEANEPQPDTSLQEETMSQETPIVEASLPDAIPTSPIFASAKKVTVMPTAVEYLSAAINGGAQWAELRAAAPDVITSDIPGVIPTPIVAPVYNNFIGRRPVVDALGARSMSAIPGSSFVRPVVTTNVSMALQSPQNSSLQSGTFVVSESTFTKGSFGGYVELSEQAMDWSQPEVLSALLDDMGRIYAFGTDKLACDAILDGITEDLGFGDPTKPEDWTNWIADAAVAILNGSNGNLPTALMVSPDVWGDLIKLTDDSGRSLFPNLGPMNAAGSLNVTTDAGSAFGLRVVVDRNFAASTLIIADPSGAEFYEQQKGALSIDSPSTMSRTIAFRGYAAAKVIDPSKFVIATGY
jgi:hypothetical protein